MKTFDYEVALNQLGLDKSQQLNKIDYDKILKSVRGDDFLKLFLPYVKVVGDSREQNQWIRKACFYYGIAYEIAKKDKDTGTENLKEGDYTFKVVFGEKVYDYTGIVAFERKGSPSEFYGNCTAERDRLHREFERFKEKKYKKVMLMLEFGEKLTDLIDMKFQYRGEGGRMVTKYTHYTLYASIMSWKQSNGYGFEVMQGLSHQELFWQMLQECFYFFRNELRIECEEKGLIKENEDEIN